MLHPHQGAYRHGRSCDDILLYAVDSITQELDEKHIVCCAFLDLRKAFDSLDHVILLQRLAALGVTHTSLKWFQNYLSDRYQRVKNVGIYSDWGTVTGGIPQGNALGPLLFLVYVNDMPLQISNGRLLQFADDTALICSGSSFGEVALCMNDQLVHLCGWITQSKMQLNCNKSSVMWFSMKPICTAALPTVSVNNTVLKIVSHHKYLGVVYDDKLQWSSHIDKVCKSMSYYLYMIGSHRTSLTHSVSKMLVELLVLSRMRYAISTWGPALQQKYISRLQRMQNRGVRLSFHLKKYDHVSSHRLGLRWLSVQDQIKQSTLSCMYRQCHYRTCLKLDPPIQFGSRHSYFTRTNKHFANITRFSTAFGQKGFRYKGTTWWNALPSDFYQIPAHTTFVRGLQDYLLLT